ncbi:la-related protein 6-like [Atheta coriaria]|uniref:la-related protein 6-like n=1 Tax=Dalotia coriaria TaxID=877792 RepID=UPI0031F4779C
MPEPLEEISAALEAVVIMEEKRDSYSPPPPKCLETRDSISSIDSDVSLSFDNKKKLGVENEKDEDEGAHMADLSDSASDTGSSGGGKDSGCEVTPEVSEQLFTPPSEELADKIVQQVEFYFSDANITKDAFLLKHVKRNKEGYVSLKLISSFKRVKHITKDWRVVAHALERSTKLEINEAGTKLRRLDPLPQYDETTPSRTVVAINLPIEKPTIENVAELFRACGEISLIRILRPGNPIPADVRQFINKNPSLAGVVTALVEFVNSESARAAQQLNTTYEQLKVYELNAVPHPERKKKTQAKKARNYAPTDTECSTCPSSSEAEDKLRADPRMRMRRGSSNYPPKCTEPVAWLQRRLSASSTEANFMFMPRRLSYGSRDSSESSLFIPRRVSNSSTSSAASSISGCGVLGAIPPALAAAGQQYQQYVPRRLSTSSVASDVSSPRSRSNSMAFQNENVVRMPKGPDGSKGFRQHRPSLGTIYS